MKNYYIKMIDGSEYAINEEEFFQLSGKTGLTYFPSIKSIINLNSVKAIISEELKNNEIKKNLTVGFLHDGGMVKKYFGRWVDYKNENIVIDQKYYPEIAKDCVFTQEEFERVKELPKEERLKMLLKNDNIIKL